MSLLVEAPVRSTHTKPRKPRLGFLGAGWIGKHRLEAIARSGLAEVAGVADAALDCAKQAAETTPTAELVSTYDALLEMDLDGVVIATPSALHAEQSILALDRGLAVFCQKPLARTGEETRSVIEAARRANRLLGVDLSYRHLAAAQAVREVLQSGELGKVFAIELVFHNAYGPGKDWFYNPKLSGGGCVIDLGIHLVDLALWLLNFPRTTAVTSRLFSQGTPLTNRWEKVEDFAVARLDLGGGAVANLSCSWKLPAGCDAIIEVKIYGAKGGVCIRNLNGSFYDFTAEKLNGTQRQTLVAPPDDWGGRAAVAWARQLATSADFNPEIERLADVADVLDSIYSRAGK
ncbi:MAG TPA: Gfo/Idh/MocA family oxidoreductase [Methylomirabilota bacterium]|nr:Gfo/Idh/MocA family oxidoreductase [Methylomirabilota bacterium]